MTVSRPCHACQRWVTTDESTHGWIGCSCGAAVWFAATTTERAVTTLRRLLGNREVVARAERFAESFAADQAIRAADGSPLHTVAEEVTELERWWALS